MTNVADLAVPGKDAIGQDITCLYGRKPPEFAVYRVPRRVMVHFADDTTKASEQRKAMAQLAPLRGEIDGLIDGWREGSSHRFFGIDNSAKLHSKALRYERRVGDALILALEGDVPTSELLLRKVRGDILNERVAWARFEYLIYAFLTGLAVMFAAWLLSAIYPVAGEHANDTAWRMLKIGGVILVIAACAGTGVFLAGFSGHGRSAPKTGGESLAESQQEAKLAEAGKLHRDRILTGLLLFAIIAVPAFTILIEPSFRYRPVHADYGTAIDIWRAAAAGSVGAFFSISLAIRGRTILPDLLRTSNLMDAVLRITIGFIAGAVVLALVEERIVNLQIGGVGAAAGALSQLDVLIIGFIAGFSERLVPDLLDKADFKPADPSAAAPAFTRTHTTMRIATAEEGGAAPGRAAAGAAAPVPDEPDPEPAQAGEDACASEIDLEDDEVTADADLPPASGGVERSG